MAEDLHIFAGHAAVTSVALADPEDIMDHAMQQKGKSQVKREMLALQSLGEQLVVLSPDQQIYRAQLPVFVFQAREGLP